MENQAAELGRRVKEEREARGWTQAELHRRCRRFDGGISPGAIGNYEQGTRPVSMRKAKILEAVFNLPAAYFLGLLTKEEALVISALREKRAFDHSKK